MECLRNCNILKDETHGERGRFQGCSRFLQCSNIGKFDIERTSPDDYHMNFLLRHCLSNKLIPVISQFNLFCAEENLQPCVH